MTRSKALSKLFADYKYLDLSDDAEVFGIAVDSRKVAEGDVFVATSDRIDGHQYIQSAIESGAVAIVGSKELELEVPFVRVEDCRDALAHISTEFYDNPADELILIGVTGTDGKTTTVNIIFSILKAAGIETGMISTVNAVIGTKALDTGFHVTTPEIFDVMVYLRQMVDAGLTHAVLETTSHGLASKRVNADDFDIGVLTNITHEHLDFHGSFEEYRDAKAKLFVGLGQNKRKSDLIKPLAVLNADDDNFAHLEGICNVGKIVYGINKTASLTAKDIVNNADKLSFKIVGPDLNIEINTSLIGNYNVSNILAAVGATMYGLGVSSADVVRGIADMEGIRGRMERVDMSQDFISIVDFAHTPNALESALKAGREITDGKVIAVFGSAGLRDKEKRKLMAEVSAEFADVSILTAEDPRTESLESILEEMAQGAISKGCIEGENMFRVADRGAAIKKAVAIANAGDLVLVLGKGHEQSMCFGEVEYAWDDVTALKAALAEYLKTDGPEIPYLPTQD